MNSPALDPAERSAVASRLREEGGRLIALADEVEGVIADGETRWISLQALARRSGASERHLYRIAARIGGRKQDGNWLFPVDAPVKTNRRSD